MTFVRVRWTDSGQHLDLGWEPVAEYVAKAKAIMAEVETVGILFHEDDDVLIVGMSYDPGNDVFFGAQVILKSNVTHRETFNAWSL